MPWIYLLLAGLLEVVWAIGLKYTEGFTKLLPSIITILAMGVSFSLLSMALKSLPVGTAYATFTGVGTVGAVIVSMIWLGEPRDAARIACVTLIIAGIVGLKVVSK